MDYGRLRNTLKEMLEQQYRGGDRIPSERKLAAQFHVSPATISRTLQDLSRLGFVRRLRGSGTYLCDPLILPVGTAVPAGATLPMVGLTPPLLRESPFESDPQLLSARPAAPLTASFSGRTIRIISGVGDLSSRPGEPERAGHRIASAIEREVQAYGGRTRIVDTQRQSEGSERALLADMLKTGTDGVVLIDQGRHMTRWLPLLLEARRRRAGDLPIVLALINDVCEWPVDCVRIDDVWGIFEATTYLLRQGHQQLGFLSPAAGFFSWADSRAAAFLRAITLWNGVQETQAVGTVLDGPAEYCMHELGCDWTSTSQALAESFLRVKGITALAAANDNVALQFMAAVRAKGVRVPEDVSLVGYDNIAEAASADLCTLDLPAEQLGIQAARLCRQRLETPGDDLRIETALKPILLLRASVQHRS